MSSSMDSSSQDSQSRIQQLLASLRDSIVQKSPVVAGSLEVSPFHHSLLYKNKSSEENYGTSHINFANATPEELEQLFEACKPAGEGSEELVDETYRKVKKMDNDRFSTLLVPDHTDLIKFVRIYLLEGWDSCETIEIKPYELNVYGEGSFFKAHLNTRHHDDMFGSLVVVFPTSHEGGTLAFRRGDQKWVFDPSDALSTAASPTSIAYAAFLCDVEHEVSPVTSGHRVTLTYNLYFDHYEHDPSKYLVSELPSVPQEEVERMFHSRLGNLLKDPEFLPDGGLLGFGIRHVYKNLTRTTLGCVCSRLRGSDATVYQILCALGFEPILYIDYQDGDRDILFPSVPEIAPEMGSESLTDLFERTGYYTEMTEMTEQVTWVTPRTTTNTLKSPYMCYRDDLVLEWACGDLCLTVRIGSPDDRLKFSTK